MYTYEINTLSQRKIETNAITIPNFTAKCFLHRTIPTEPQRVSSSKPVLFSGGIPRPAQCSNLAQSRNTELTNTYYRAPRQESQLIILLSQLLW